MKIQLDRVVVTAVEGDIPEACPRCGADFTGGDALEEQQLCFGSQACAIVGDVVDNHGESESGDCAYVTGFRCSNCREEVVSEPIEEHVIGQGDALAVVEPEAAATAPGAPVMASYRVTWSIDVDAEDDVTAAREAQRYQRKPGAEVGVFEVTDKEGRTVTIDLDAHTVEERASRMEARAGAAVNATSCDHCAGRTADLQTGACSLGDPCQLCPGCRADSHDGRRELRTKRLRIENLRAIEGEASILGTVYVFGVLHHAWFVRVEEQDGDQVAVDDPHGRLEEFQQLDVDRGAMQTVDVPGYPGEYVLVIYPAGQ